MRNEKHLSEQVLNMYLDGELSIGERGRVEAHLAVCSECHSELLALQALFNDLNELAPARAPNLLPGVLARIQPRRRFLGLRLPRPRSLWLVPALQATAALALLAWGWTRLIGYWAVATDALSLGTLGDVWAEASGWVTAQWATLPAWPDVRWWFTRLPAFDGPRLPPAQLAMLGGTLAVLWAVGNVALLRRALLNGRVT